MLTKTTVFHDGFEYNNVISYQILTEIRVDGSHNKLVVRYIAISDGCHWLHDALWQYYGIIEWFLMQVCV